MESNKKQENNNYNIIIESNKNQNNTPKDNIIKNRLFLIWFGDTIPDYVYWNLENHKKIKHINNQIIQSESSQLTFI